VAQLFIAHGAPRQAAFWLHSILGHQPDNPRARQLLIDLDRSRLHTLQ
jgi:hypothetical protein